MRTINQWLSEYGESHQNSTNKLLHWICVPLIVFSLLGMFWSISTPAVFDSLPFRFNWAGLIIVLAMAYYLFISPSLAIGMLVVVFLLLAIFNWMDSLSVPVWLLSLVIFIAAWIGQFIGHHVEGKRPSFFKDVQFLLIGPLWLLSFLYRKLGIPY